MSKLGINTGSTPNDGTGDSLLSGAEKINSNFDELYSVLGDGSTLSPVTSIVAGTNVSVSSSTGNVTINAAGGGGGGGAGIDVQDEGVALATTATALNFVGSGVNASGTGAIKTITISGGSGVGTENVSTNSLVVSGVSTLGVVTGATSVQATKFYGDGSSLTGNVTSLTAGDNISLSGSTGDVTVTGLAKTDNINADTLVVSGLTTTTNEIEIRSDDGVPARIDFYCEVNNLHYARIQAPPHSEFSGNITSKLPTKSGDIIVGDTDGAITQNINTTGVVTTSSVDATTATIGAGSSLNGIESPVVKLSFNNPTIAGTSGTTGEIKSIGGAPFYYDGTNWREFVLATGTPVSQPEDSDWDQVIFRNDFDTSLTEQRFGQTIYSGTSNNVSLVSSPVKVGTKSVRIGYPNGGGLAYPKRNEYDFTGAWTVEGWFYLDTLPTGSGLSAVPLFAHSYLTNKVWGLNVELQSAGLVNFMWLNNSSTTHLGPRGTILGQYSISADDILHNRWTHIALIRKASNGTIHLFVNGVESTATSSDQIIDNDIPPFQPSYELWFGQMVPTGTTSIYMDGNIDDIRISISERYTANFNPPTTALPIAGTSSTSYTPPGSLLGEITLGNSPVWTGTTGVTPSRINSGHYRATFSSSYGNSNDYIITTSMNDHIPSTTPVGIGVSRFTAHADFFVNRVSDGVGIDSGSLAVDLYKK